MIDLLTLKAPIANSKATRVDASLSNRRIGIGINLKAQSNRQVTLFTLWRSPK
jgi:hypothetical protein